MGEMINVLFDLNAEMGGTKLISDRARRDGSPSQRNRSDAVKKSMDSGIVHAENKHVIIANEMRKSSSIKKSRGTSMKMFLAQEMPNEIESKRKQPNVVARLMGLDEPLPAYQSVQTSEGKSDSIDGSSHLKDGYFERLTPCKVHSCTHEVKYTDEYEVHLKDEPPQKGMCDEIENEKRMALVRQKFMEAKRLATDEKLLGSKEFQDAVEVLSSNRDLFLKFLEEPMSLFSKHLKELHSTPDAHQTKRITVLKPSGTFEVKGDNSWDKNKVQRSSSMTQSTRIVILKPSPVKHHDTKPMREKDDFYQALDDTKSLGSRNAAKDITQPMTESVGSIRRDESLLSSVLSNGYIGDESSFNKSENEYERGEDGNFSDSSRHSWDYSNRFGSPYSLTSFSRASCSPERLMIREAKKRLSERWTLVASTINSREEMEVKKSSSTLGEMLGVGSLNVSSGRSHSGEEDLKVPSVSSSTCQSDIGNGAERSNLNLLRSKSVPASSVFEDTGLNPEVPDSQIKKPIIPKDASRSKNRGKSFKWKVSSLFFSRNKKGGREKSISPELQSSSAEPVGEIDDDLLHPDYGSQPDKCSSLKSDGDSIKGSSPALIKGASKEGTISLRAVLSLEKRSASESSSDNQNEVSSCNKICENQNQPSPTSVLDGPFENDISNNIPNSSEISNARRHSLAPIKSVARTLSRDDTNLDALSPNTLLSVVHNILSTAGLDSEKPSTLFSKWHSVDSPLDPNLLNKFLDRKEESARSRERRSNQRLVFDCVNYALLEVGRVCIGAGKKHLACTSIEDEVCSLIRDWFFRKGNSESGETENSSLVVDKLLRKEVGGSGWIESMQSEIDVISKEIGGEVLKDLVAEVLECLSP